MKVKLSDQKLFIEAPREMVFQTFSSIDEGGVPKESGESVQVLERTGNTIIAEFRTKLGRRKYRTLEKINLYPTERITFKHLEGPLNFAEEEFNLLERGAGTELQYRGEIEYKVPLLPGLGWFISRYYVKRKYDAVVRKHTEKMKSIAEARAGGHQPQRPQTVSSGGTTAGIRRAGARRAPVQDQHNGLN